MTREEAIQALWDAQYGLWRELEERDLLPGETLEGRLRNSSMAYRTTTIRGKDLYDIGAALGLIGEDEDA